MSENMTTITKQQPKQYASPTFLFPFISQSLLSRAAAVENKKEYLLRLTPFMLPYRHVAMFEHLVGDR